MKLRKRTLLIITVIFIISLIGLSVYNSSRAPKKVKAKNIRRGNLQVTISASGKIGSASTAELSFTSTGRISYLPFKEGDRVKKGQVLAYLDGSTIKEQENKAWADYRGVLEKLREFENNNKDKPKDDKYTISKAQLEAQRDSYAALVGQTLSTYKDKTLISPIDGLISSITAQVGETPTTQPVISVVDDTQLEFIAEIDEQDIGSVTPGLAADIYLDAFKGQMLQGTVTKIETIAKTGTTGNTYYPVKIAIETSDKNLLIGMGGDVDIKTAEKQNVLLTPLDIIQDGEGKRYLFTIEDGMSRKKEIKTGLESESDAEVISGVEEGAQVITGDTSTLTEGMHVVTEK